ncbi:MAG: phosphoribosylaminoimidazolesuccinocarboxamide synthase, partial [Thermoplasmata archaeon]|nr:phosphoribosylaminoimidazolesuccinocarboxamide synthase [Thermoplasmata archaeon]
MKLLRVGKVKEVYEVDEDQLEFRFTDNISVFDKVIPTSIPKKGETLCRTSAFWFDRAPSLGIRHHLLKVLDGNRMRVKRVEVIPDYARLNAETTRYLVPLEWVARYYVAGSLLDRMKKGLDLDEARRTLELFDDVGI